MRRRDVEEADGVEGGGLEGLEQLGHRAPRAQRPRAVHRGVLEEEDRPERHGAGGGPGASRPTIQEQAPGGPWVHPVGAVAAPGEEREVVAPGDPREGEARGRGALPRSAAARQEGTGRPVGAGPHGQAAVHQGAASCLRFETEERRDRRHLEGNPAVALAGGRHDDAGGPTRPRLPEGRRKGGMRGVAGGGRREGQLAERAAGPSGRLLRGGPHRRPELLDEPGGRCVLRRDPPDAPVRQLQRPAPRRAPRRGEIPRRRPSIQLGHQTAGRCPPAARKSRRQASGLGWSTSPVSE